jgi:F-type H+-transporting ATPase subunit a
MFATIALLAALQGAAPALAQEPAAPVATEAAAAAAESHAASEEFDILHHLQNSREIETPVGTIHLPAKGSWMVGPLDLTPTKHVVFLWLTALVLLAIFLPGARAAKRSRAEGRSPKGGHNALEAMVLFLRDQVIMPNVGKGGEGYVPFVATLFFFILIANLLGILPWGATATGNLSVTAALAIISLVVIELAGMRTLGAKGYLGTIVFVPQGLPKPLVPVMALIMTPVELLGKLTKPFALAIRLFANMTAGHVLLLAIISLIFVFGSLAVAVAPVLMAVAITFLELFVAALQAYIFALLTSVFIGLIRTAH